VLVAVFAVGARGGSEDPQNLVDLGALVLPTHLVGDGVAWRVVAAGFLHFGATHLVVNLLGLWLLGREVERVWNGPILLAVFLGSSVGAFALAVAFVGATAEAPRVMLGASAGVLGLVGALFAFATIRYLSSGHRWLGRQILVLLAVIATQVVFDAFTPQVSSFLHLAGLGIGSGMGGAFTWSHPLRASRT
jgi:membrane associated rhomboid family serine protease